MLGCQAAKRAKRLKMNSLRDPLPNIEQQSLFDLPVPVATKKRAAVKSARSGTFTDNMKLPVHRWFRYSAGFSAEWVEGLIKQLSPAAVLDPFAGSGTTLLAAEASGTMAYGFESHPFVARIALAKTHWNQDENKLFVAAKAVLEAARSDAELDPGVVPDPVQWS
jgi:hypothetical protein